MPQLLLINPGRKVKPMAKRRTAAQKRATAKMIAANRARAGGSRRRAARKSPKRRRNPLPVVASARRVGRRVKRTARRTYSRIRRRRNPISMGRASSYIGMFKDAAIQGGGAVAVDIGYAYVEGMLPASLQRTPGRIGLGDAVKAVATVAAGKFLSRFTRGLSMKAAQGALTVQAHGLVSALLPAGMTAGRVGWMVAAPVIPGTARVGPNGQVQGRVGAYMTPGQTALLNGGRTGAYMPPGATPLLAGVGAPSAAAREGWGGRR